MTRFLPQELIRKKRDRAELTSSELKSFFTAYLEGDVEEYQASAMLMAMFLNGMTFQETVTMTKCMRDSGTVFDWGAPHNNVVDKHSTGGIGDKTSLIILPLCALEGLRIPMISGRGLGHTGGTLDKLESIEGMSVHPDPELSRKILSNYGGVFMGQTGEIAALDKRLYALRDVTATVECIPLICSSILSKKLAEGLNGLVLDVKFGSGAFIQDIEQSKELAHMLVRVANECGLKAKAFLTDMNSPLGTKAGNALEVEECVEIMQGSGPEDTKSLSVELATAMVQLANPERNREDIRTKLENHLQTGAAFEAFAKIIEAQGGDPRCLSSKGMAKPLQKRDILARESGFVEKIDVRALGIAILEMGGGRRKTSDKIDPNVGLTELKHVGDPVKKGEPIATLFGAEDSSVTKAHDIVREAYQIGPTETRYTLINEEISG